MNLCLPHFGSERVAGLLELRSSLQSLFLERMLRLMLSDDNDNDETDDHPWAPLSILMQVLRRKIMMMMAAMPEWPKIHDWG